MFLRDRGQSGDTREAGNLLRGMRMFRQDGGNHSAIHGERFLRSGRGLPLRMTNGRTEKPERHGAKRGFMFRI